MKKLLFVLVLLVTNHFVHGQDLKILRKTVIGGEGGWDYLSVDPDNRRLYISHSTQVEVLNADTHEKIGVIPNLKGVHGVIAVPRHGRGITSNGRSNSATIFDLKTLAPIAELATGKNPDALLYDPYSDRVFMFDHSGGTCTVIDIASAKVIGTVVLGGDAVEAGVTDGKGTIYVNLEDSNEIVSFDAKSLVIRSRLSIAPCNEPTGMAIDVKNQLLFSVCHNEKLMVIDIQTGKVIRELPIGKRVDGVAFDAASGLIVSSNGEGTCTVIKEVSTSVFTVLGTVKTMPGARTIAFDAHTHHVFVMSAEYGPAPAPTPENPNPRPPVVPGTFTLLELGMQ
jgi:DNA-binding beta-propeller fold protein YncE